MTPPIDARTRLIALVGDPVEHSLSPRIQNAAFSEAGVPGVYLALRTEAEAVSQLMRAIAHAGGGGNVTVPHKGVAAAALDQATEAVRRTGACNTFWGENDLLCGDNTDVQGFRAAVLALLGESARGARVLLVGAGGAARAALAALEDDGAERATLVNRTRERAEGMIRRFQGSSLALESAPDAESLRGQRFDLVVNATSLGLRAGDPPPLPHDVVEFGAALDLVYTADGTAWTRTLREAGIPAADGTEMLIQQGAAAFSRWWARPAPIDAMRDALLARP